MAETGEVTREELTEAVLRIDDALEEETTLRTRTEGLTWILWGLVTAAVVLTFDAVFFMYGGVGAVPEPWSTLLWVPWVGIGAALTSVLWRSAALSRPELTERQQGGLLVTAAYIAFIVAVWFLVVWLVPGLNSDTIAVLAIGTAWLFFGVWNPFRVTPTGRRVMILQGMVILSAGILLAATLPASQQASNQVATLVNLFASAGVPVVGGAWQATRG